MKTLEETQIESVTQHNSPTWSFAGCFWQALSIVGLLVLIHKCELGLSQNYRSTPAGVSSNSEQIIESDNPDGMLR